MTTITRSLSETDKIKNSRFCWRWLYILPAVVVAAVLVFNIFRPITVLPRISLAPGYAFTSQDGIQWDFLSGDPNRTKYAVGAGFGVYYRRDPAGWETKAAESTG